MHTYDLSEAEPCPKRRRIHVLNVEDVEEEEDYRDKYIGMIKEKAVAILFMLI